MGADYRPAHGREADLPAFHPNVHALVEARRILAVSENRPFGDEVGVSPVEQVLDYDSTGLLTKIVLSLNVNTSPYSARLRFRKPMRSRS